MRAAEADARNCRLVISVVVIVWVSGYGGRLLIAPLQWTEYRIGYVCTSAGAVQIVSRRTDTMEGMTPPVASLHEGLVQIDLTPRKPAAKPAWLKAKAPMGETFHNLKKMARELNLHTVCESAQCPNIGECWNQKSATFMMLGNLCTRRCGFCAVPKGKPEPIDLDEPRRVAYAVAQLGLAHAVITSVNRDDDNVGAARAFVSVIEEIRMQAPSCRVEVLTPDFQGVEEALRLVVAARPEILNHNIETVPRLYRVAKSGGRYERSLGFLAGAKAMAAEMFSDREGDQIVTKTGIIVGMGEEMHELLAVFRDLADRRVDILTIGQYLRPSRDHLPMARYYTPDEFAFLKHEALGMGFKHVESGPLVRSSYHAQEQAESTGLA
jgi:lipoic acid synthetase